MLPHNNYMVTRCLASGCIICQRALPRRQPSITGVLRLLGVQISDRRLDLGNL